LLRVRVEEMGVHVHVVRRTQSIDEDSQGRPVIRFANADPLTADVVIIAAGVRPRDDLGKQAGLKIGERGGIIVDSELRTSDEHIAAIGECVRFRGHVYGLVAPCYRMADVLAERLSGIPSVFRGADESAELKLLGVQVASLGLSLGESRGGVTLTHQDENGYRKVLLEKGRVVGASCVGTWDELPQIRQAIHKQQHLWPMQRRRFRKTGTPWAPGGAIPIRQWPADSVVCSCLGVVKSTLTSLIEAGIDEPDELAEKSGATTACGSCRSLVCELAGSSAETQKSPGATPLLVASVIAAIAGVAMFLVPPISLADSVQSGWRRVDWLWRSDFARQVTGFTLVGLTLVGMTFALRKRLDWFRWGHYGMWRALHGILGALVLIGLAVHTGFSLGENLNALLGICFIGASVVGAAAGIASSLESRLVGRAAMEVRRWRPRITKFHYWFTWPLPVLIVLHIFSFYWFRD
ncbi:MAG: FAD-dependent oxidoreductase, partial [Planctomycetota bacterium]